MRRRGKWGHKFAAGVASENTREERPATVLPMLHRMLSMDAGLRRSHSRVEHTMYLHSQSN